MSNRVLVFLASLLLLITALGSYVYYRRTLARVPVDPWSLVPDDAALVVVTRDHPTLIRHLKETQVWDNLTAVRYFQQVEENLTMVDSLTGGRDVVLRFLGRKRVLTSVHVTGPGPLRSAVSGAHGQRARVPAGARAARRPGPRRPLPGNHPRLRGTGADRHARCPTATIGGCRPNAINYRNQLVFSANGRSWWKPWPAA